MAKCLHALRKIIILVGVSFFSPQPMIAFHSMSKRQKIIIINCGFRLQHLILIPIQNSELVGLKTK